MQPKRTSTDINLPLALLVYFVFLTLAGLFSPGAVFGPSSHEEVGMVAYVVFCFVTGVVEEAVFCGAVYQLLLKRSGQEQGNSASRDAYSKTLQAAVITALLFGLAHLSLASGYGMAALKVLQAFSFSMCMIGLFVITRNLVWPMLTHSVFDIAYFAWPYSQTGTLPPYASTVSLDANLVVLASTALLFAVAAYIMFKFAKDRRTGN